jgi:signal peptidase
MARDKKVLYTLSVVLFAILLLVLFVGDFSKVLGAVLMSVGMVLICFFVKKRTALSMYKGQVLIILIACALLYVMLLYLSSIKLGYINSFASLSPAILFKQTIPIIVLIITSEIIRRVLCAQEDKLSSAVCYLICVISEIIALNTSARFSSFNSIMNFAGIVVLPSIISNLVYNFFSKRYGAIPNIAMRLIISLYPYIIPRIPALDVSIQAIASLIFPIVVYGFVSALYERKRQYALKQKTKYWYAVPVLMSIVMISIVMLISCQFRFGAIVIGSESMTGELNKGDITIYEQRTDQIISQGQVIVFNKDKTQVIHRVVKIERVNGVTRYYTKGDANKENDIGYITDSNIVGLAKVSVPYLGYPTIWLRSLIDKVL